MQQDKPIIELRNISFLRGEALVLDSINLKLYPGILLGLLGPNGGGKTTLLRIILGEIEPDNGAVLIDGVPRKKVGHDTIKIGYLPQKHDFNRNIPITVLQTVMMGRYKDIGLFRSPGKKDREAAMKAIAMLDIEDLTDRLVGELSGGQTQRVLTARALVSYPEALLLDEPEAGVDIETSDRFMRLLAQLRDELNLGIIFVSHDIGTITRHADKIACLNRSLHFHDKPCRLSKDDFQKTFGKECELLMHTIPTRSVEGHDV